MSAPYIFIQAGTACPPINGGCHRGMPGCVAGVLQVCYSVLQYVAVLCPSMEAATEACLGVLRVCCRCVTVCCSMLQCVVPINGDCHGGMLGVLRVCCRCVTACFGVLQRVVPINGGCHEGKPRRVAGVLQMCGSVLQNVAVCCTN